MNPITVPSSEGEPVEHEDEISQDDLSALTPEEQDDVVLAAERVAGSGYLKLKRRGLRRRGKPIRRTMWEPQEKNDRLN